MSFAEISENLGVTVSFDRVLRDEYEITVERMSDDVVATLPGQQLRYANDRFDSVFLAVRSALYEKVVSQRTDMAIFKLGHLSISSAFRPEQALTGIDLYAITLALEESNVPENVKGTFQLAGGPLKPWVKFARLQQGLHQLRRLPLQAVQLPGYSEVPLPEVSPIDLFAGKIGSYVSAFPMQLQLGEGYSTRVEGNKTLVFQRKTVFDVFGLNYVDCAVPDFELVRVARRPPVLEEPMTTHEFFAQTNDEAVNFFTSHLRSAKGRSAFSDFESLSIYDFGSKDGEILWKMLPNRVKKDFFQTFKTVNAQHKDVGEIITILAEKILPEADQRTARLLVAARLLAQRGQLTYVGGCLQAR